MYDKMEENLENMGSYYGNIPEEDFEKYAVMFGEGSQALTDLLLYCWQNGIKTFASCKGHTGVNGGYIGFLPDEELLRYMCELSDQIELNGIDIDRYFDGLRKEFHLRATFYVKKEHDFKVIKSLIQKYVDFKNKGYQYNNRFKETDELVECIIESGLWITLKGGKYHIHGGSRVDKEGEYCPKYSITHILHSKIMGVLDKSFTSENSPTRKR